MSASQIVAIVALGAVGALIAIAVPVLQRRAKRLYLARFAALGARDVVADRRGVRCELDRDGRHWQLAMVSPLAVKRSTAMTRDDTPRIVARVELAHPAPLDLQIVPSSDEPVARRDHKRVEQPACDVDQLEIRAAAPADATRALTPDVVAAVQRANDVPIVDLELRVRRGDRTIECTKLYGARDLPAFVAAVGAIADGLDRAFAAPS